MDKSYLKIKIFGLVFEGLSNLKFDINEIKKILLAAAVFYFGVSEAQQSQYFTQKENYRFNLAQNLYQTKIYNASQYEYARQYFYNQNLEQSKKKLRSFLIMSLELFFRKIMQKTV